MPLLNKKLRSQRAVSDANESHSFKAGSAKNLNEVSTSLLTSLNCETLNAGIADSSRGWKT